MGRRRQEKALEDALARTLAAGVEAGRRDAFERVLKELALDALGLEVKDTTEFVQRAGLTDALRMVAEAARTVWPTRYRERLSGVLSALMQAAAGKAAPVLGSFTLQNPRMADYFEDYVDKLGRDLSETSRKNAEHVIREAMDEGLSNPAAAERLREKLPELNETRSTLIARNETHRASIAASELQAKESGIVTTKTWLTAHDERVRPAHKALDGVTVGIDEEFPGGLHPTSEIQCRCVLTYGVDLDAVRGGAA